MTQERLRQFYNNNRACLYNGKIYSLDCLAARIEYKEAKKCLMPENWSYEEWLERSRAAGHLLRQQVCNPLLPEVKWDGIVEIRDKKPTYNTQLCLCDGKKLQLQSLIKRFRRHGIANAIEEAKKYLIK